MALRPFGGVDNQLGGLTTVDLLHLWGFRRHIALTPKGFGWEPEGGEKKCPW